ncbi:MAG: polysaccharide biosynthesis protein [Bdellovibrionales bacterium]
MKFQGVILRHSIIITHDVLMAAVAYALALYLRLGVDALKLPQPEAWIAFGIYLGMCAATFCAMGLYRGVWRYTSLHDMTVIVRASLTSIFLFVVAVFVLTRGDAVPRSLPALLLFILPCLLAASRIGYRLFREQRLTRIWSRTGQASPILLLGVGDEAEIFIRTAARDPKAAWRIVGLIDDKGGRVGRKVHNVNVLGTIDDLPALITSLERAGNRPAKLILTRAPTNYSSDQLRKAMDISNRLDLPLGRLPSITELRLSLEAGPALIRPIAVEDLLGRPETNLRIDDIRALVQGKRVIVTGAGGTIGSELVQQIAALHPHKLVMIDNGEFNLYTIDQYIRDTFSDIHVHTLLADVRDRSRMESIFITEQPDVVFHAAALKHVPLAETNIREAVLTNVQGTRNVADAARLAQARAMVMISTDKAINPTNVMGATKRVAESYCQAMDLVPGSPTRFLTVRFGNVLGSSGSVVPLFQKQLQRGGPLTVTHPDITRYFMTVKEAISLVLQASAYGLSRNNDRGKIFVLDMGKPVKIIDLARQMIRLAGLRPDDDIKIDIVGLRPGEKLYEELFDPNELVQADVDGVFVAAPRVQDATTMTPAVNNLITIANGGATDTELAASITTLVPEYQPGGTTAPNVVVLPQRKATQA